MSRPYAYSLRLFDRLTSTNDHAQQALKEGASDGTIIQAMDQYAGRGQGGNVWRSVPGENLTLSIILRPKLPATRAFVLSQMTALALYHTLQAFLPDAEVLIKWPNDLLLNGRKVGGILIENQLQGSLITNSILGIGLNVNQQQFPADLAARTESMRRVMGHAISLDEVRRQLLQKLDKVRTWVHEAQWDRLDRAYRAALYGYQETLWVEIDGTRMQRTIVGVASTGQLALANGQRLQHYDVKAVHILLPVEQGA